MKKIIWSKLWMLSGFLFCALNTGAQNPINWTNKQLMEPSTLADIIHTNPKEVDIISVGPFKTIPGAINVGMVSEEVSLDKLKSELSGIKKDRKIVIYCGCCPFDHCPNVRPAIDVLKAMKFTNYYLLDLPRNLKINWIDKGFPVVKQ